VIKRNICGTSLVLILILHALVPIKGAAKQRAGVPDS
jgi:hypothetical protein